MDLFIANATKQDTAFTYRVAEQKSGHHKVDIRAGGQVNLKNLDSKSVEGIIDHHRAYGMRHINEVKRTRGFVGLVYSDEGEITADGIAHAVEHNTQELNVVGRKLREAAAVAVDQSLLATAPEGSELKATHVDVVEHEDKKKEGSTEINDRFTVKPKADENLDRRGHADPSKVLTS